MATLTNIALFFIVATTLPAATTYAVTDCGPFNPIANFTSGTHGGTSGATHADCFAHAFDFLGRDARGEANADVFITQTSAEVRTTHSVDTHSPLPVTAHASYGAQFDVTFLGDPGYGFFTPCFYATVLGGAAPAVAVLVSRPANVPAFGTGVTSMTYNPPSGESTNCGAFTNPGSFAFAFGQPLRLAISLDAEDGMYLAGIGRAQVEFRYSFIVSRTSVNDQGVRSYVQVQDANWSITEADVPEPGTAGLIAFALTFMVLAKRRLA